VRKELFSKANLGHGCDMTDLSTRKTLPHLDESLLIHLPPFSRLGPRDIRTIIDQSTSLRYAAGTSVFAEGEQAERFYMLLDGYVRVVRTTPTGDQVTMMHIPAGQLLGIAKVIGRETYPATAITVTESIGLSWPTRLWETFMADYDGFATETYKAVGERLGEMNNRIVELATQQVEQRVANAILRLINQTGRKVEGGIEIDFPITRRDLSEMTGTTLHTVSRLLSGWEKQGFVETKSKRIKVCNPPALMKLSQGLDQSDQF